MQLDAAIDEFASPAQGNAPKNFEGLNFTQAPARVLLVDDDVCDLKRLQRAVAAAFPDTKIVLADNVRSGVEKLAAEPFDCVVTDHHLTDGTGVDLALQTACIIDDPVPPPIVMVTADEQATTAVNALRVGIYDFIIKSDLTPSSIQRAINHALEKSRLQRANVAAHRALFVQAEELQRSNEALTQFAAVASHDLKEPLRTIGGFTQLLEKRYRDQIDSEGQEYLDFIVDAVGRMNGLIDGLLQFAKVGQQSALEEVDLNDVVASCLASLNELIESNQAQIQVGELPKVTGDRRLLGQLLQNLITNAIKFRGEPAPEVQIEAKRQADAWQISVQDNGIGIAEQHFERIFKIFTRLHARDEYAGSGIGLSLCKRIAEHHRGQILVQSAPGEGSCFTIELPVPDAAAAQNQSGSEDHART